MRSRPIRCIGRRCHSLPVVLLLVLCVLVATRLWLADVIESVLRPQLPDHDLSYLRRSRDLKYYLQNIQLLIEPSSTRCEGVEEVPLLVLVASSPSHLNRRGAIRNSWAKHFPTLFFLGVDGLDRDQALVDSYIEAKESGDMVVFDFLEHYDNLTLKTALMLHWSQKRCTTASAVLKTDDDVFVNPWVMKEVLKAHKNSQLIGYMLQDSKVHRDEYSKWYLPQWLFSEDYIREFLTGPGYVIQGEYINAILKASYKIPIVNLEDVYFTFIVSKDSLALSLTHDRRLSPYKPWLATGCAFWGLASVHRITPNEMIQIWNEIKALGKRFERGEEVCTYLGFLSNDIFLH